MARAGHAGGPPDPGPARAAAALGLHPGAGVPASHRLQGLDPRRRHAEFKGMANAGYTANLVLSHDKSALLRHGDLLVARHPRRPDRRRDHLRHQDARAARARSFCPAGRFLVAPKKHNAQLTTDGRYLLSFNMDPGFGLSVVDVKENRYVGEIETGGCSLAFPTGPRASPSLCPDGSFAHITFDGDRQGHDRERPAVLRFRERSGLRARGAASAEQARPSSSPTRAGSTR